MILNTPSKNIIIINKKKPFSNLPFLHFKFTNFNLGIRKYSTNSNINRKNSSIRKLHGSNPSIIVYLSILYKDGILIIFDHISLDIVYNSKINTEITLDYFIGRKKLISSIIMILDYYKLIYNFNKLKLENSNKLPYSNESFKDKKIIVVISELLYDLELEAIFKKADIILVPFKKKTTKYMPNISYYILRHISSPKLSNKILTKTFNKKEKKFKLQYYYDKKFDSY